MLVANALLMQSWVRKVSTLTVCRPTSNRRTKWVCTFLMACVNYINAKTADTKHHKNQYSLAYSMLIGSFHADLVWEFKNSHQFRSSALKVNLLLLHLSSEIAHTGHTGQQRHIVVHSTSIFIDTLTGSTIDPLCNRNSITAATKQRLLEEVRLWSGLQDFVLALLAFLWEIHSCLEVIKQLIC